MNSDSSSNKTKANESLQVTESDSNFLLGILALQMNYIDREQLVEAVSAWTSDKSKTLEEIFREKEWLTQHELEQLQPLVEKQLENAEDNTELNLDVTMKLEDVRKDLEDLGDDDINTILLNTEAKYKLQESASSATSSAPIPTSVSDNRFTPISELGRGGMGKVSLADDLELHRKVALKELLVNHEEYPEVHRRFVLEAEITGSLEHPGIVPIYSSNHAHDGRPYYAMQIIRGKNMHDAIMEFHKEKSENPNSPEIAVKFRQMIGRFIDVCQAIDYAHSRSVIHRDIKPSNVMLGEFGETYVVDWGLAKAQVPGAYESTLDRTAFIPRSSSDTTKTNLKSTLGTPAFMSPEQAARNWEAIGPPSDIYSLGATLYCLIVGKPYVTGKKLTTVLQQVQTGEFPRPREVAANVHPALEAIVLKGMALEISDRYETAGAMAKDLENWLADEPVEAWEEPFLVKLGRWARRHQTQIRAAITGLVILFTLSIFLSIQLSNSLVATKAAKETAEEHFQESRLAVDTWLTVAGEKMKYFPALQQSRKALLELAAKDYERFAGLIVDDEDLQTEYGRTLLRLGDIQKDLEEYESAEKSYQSAKTIFDGFSKKEPENTEYQIYSGISMGRIAGLLSQSEGKEKEASAAFENAIDLLEKASIQDLENDRLKLVKAQILVSTSEFLEKSNQLERAHTVLQSAIVDLEKLVAANEETDENKEYRWQLSKALLRMGELQRSRHQDSESLAANQTALEILEELSKDDPAHPGYYDDMASIRIGIANSLFAANPDDVEIDKWYQAGIKNFENLVELIPDVTRYRKNLIVAIGNYSQYLHRIEKNPVAENLLVNYAFDQLRTLQTYDESGHEKSQAISLAILGRVSNDLKKHQKAVEYLLAATISFKQAILQDSQDKDLQHWNAICQSQLGQAYAGLGKDIDAKAGFLNSISEFEKLVTSDLNELDYQHGLAAVLKHHADLMWNLDEKQEAKATFSRALLLWGKLTDKAEYLHEHALLLANCPDPELKDPSKAIELANQAIKLVSNSGTYMNTLGQSLYRDGQWEESQKTLLKAKDLRSHENSFDHFYIAMCRWQMEKKAEAKVSYAQAVDLMQKNQPGNLVLQSLEDEVRKLLEVAEN